MSNELSLSYQPSQTINALLFDSSGNRWNGTSFVAISTIADAAWATGAISLPEKTTSNSTHTGQYVGNFPSAIVTAGQYFALFYLGTPAVGDTAIGQQSIDWTGTGLASLPTIQSSFASIPTAAQNRAEMDSNSTKLTAIKAKTDNYPYALDFTPNYPASGALPEGSLVGYQYNKFGPHTFAGSFTNGNTFRFDVYREHDSDTVLWSLSGSNVVAVNNVITVEDLNNSADMTKYGSFRYILRNTTTNKDSHRGQLVIFKSTPNA